ncbi:TIGR03986 family type III CRISPR-associated RAMP protein [Microcoleus sp. herbarium12]|uniref:TIGR03986 family type III CRISPR-associated RAMP protein n=1 Tax=Microcoleus sp. herbarium12 TaxID=3055437 RepID=UPI002FD325F1
MNPKHIKKIETTDRIAKAPYNFVELPEKVVESELPLPEGDRYHSERNTGRIECTLTTKSQLYTRCAWSPDDFAKYSEPPTHKTKEDKDRWEKEEKAKWEKKRREILANFFSYPGSSLAEIPGSSLRGMLRTLVEIVSFGKIDRVSDAQKLFFRAVAADKNDPLKHKYKLQNVQAGYLNFDRICNKWQIYPALILDDKNKLSYIPIKEANIKSHIRSLILMKKDNYLPQYIDISFKLGSRGDILVSEDVHKYPSPENQGVLVTSGNMLETSNLTEEEKEAKLKSKKGRKNHYLISKQYGTHQVIEISQEAILDYISALTDFQSGKVFKDNFKNPFNSELGVLKDCRPIFYCQPQAGEPVTLFGQSPNFRIPYSHQGNGKAATARDFIPDFLKDSKDKPAITDIAEAIFGFVRRDKQPEGREQSRAGRVFISDGILKPHQEEKVQQSLNQEPKTILLSSPKPTTFQHYLVQSQETGANKSQLKHYASPPPNDTEPGKTVIRGHKLYWHKPAHIEVPSDTSDTQTSLIKPIDEDINFSFTIYFENLSKVELGALLWVLDRADRPEYCLSVGMGKPLGMGAVKVKIDELWLGDRTQRYNTLFTDDNNWEYGKKANTDSEREDCIKNFEDYVLKNIHENDYPEGSKATSLDELPRIKMLLAMLQYEGFQHSQDAEYMTIEPNEYKERRVLPTPLQVAGIDDRRVDQTSSPSTRENIVVKSERQVEIAKAVQSKKFEIGQILEATVGRINNNQVTYHMLEVLKLTQKEPKKAALLTEGQAVHVKITAIKEDGSIKSVKWVE